MSLEKQIDKDYIQAMKDKNSQKSSALSYLRAMIKQVKVDQRLDAVDDAGVVTIIKKQIKQRQDSIEQFTKGGRLDLVDKEQSEVDLMKAYLPQEMSETEIGVCVEAAIRETGATSMKEMGVVIKAVREKTAGCADGKLVSDVVKAKLSAL